MPQHLLCTGAGEARLPQDAHKCEGDYEDCGKALHPGVYQLPPHRDQHVPCRAGPEESHPATDAGSCVGRSVVAPLFHFII